MARYRMHDGELLPLHEWARHQPPPKRSHLAKPYIRTDGMASTVNPVDGREYDSRSAYERTLKTHDCHVVEPGENTGKLREMESPAGLERDIKDAIEQLEAR